MFADFFQKIVATIRNISSFSPATAWDTIGEWWKDCSDDKEFPGPTPGAPVVESSHENVTSPFVSESASNTTLCAGDDLPPLKQADASMECPSSPEGPGKFLKPIHLVLSCLRRSLTDFFPCLFNTVYQDPRNDNVLDKTTEMRDVDPAVEAEPAATVCLTVVPSDATLECDIKRNVADMDEIMTQIDFIVKSASKKKYRRNRPRGTVPSPQVSGHKRAERDSEHGVCPEKNAKKLRLTSGEDKYEKNTEKPSGASDIETEVEPPLSVITGKRSEQDWEDDDSFEARPAKRGRLSSPRSQTSADSSPHCPVPETHSQLPVSQSTEAGVAPLPDDDGTAKDDSAKSAVEKTLDELRDEALRLCQGFESVGRIFWSMLDNCQGYHNGTCNGCAVISFAVALRHLVSAHILKNCEIDAAIIDDSPVLLKKIRGETQSQLDPHDVKEELCQLGLWSDEQYLGSCGGNILGTDLSSFVQTFSENPGKVASTVLFHGHVISILKSFRDDGTAFYDIVDSMPHDNQPGKGGSRYRCMDSESVVALLSFYAFSKLSEEDLKTEYDAGKAYSGLEPRFFEAALWKPASTLDERTRQEGIDRLHAGIEQEKEDRILDGFRAEVARRDEALARQWQHCYNVSLCY